VSSNSADSGPNCSAGTQSGTKIESTAKQDRGHWNRAEGEQFFNL
jgi:hypothetical protein